MTNNACVMALEIELAFACIDIHAEYTSVEFY